MFLSRRFILSLLISASVVGGYIAGPTEAAATTVTGAIKTQDRAIRHSPAFKKLAHFDITTPAQAKKVIPEFRAAARKLDHAAAVVSKATASSAQQKQGQSDWVTGARDLAHGISQLVVALKDLENGNAAAVKTEVRAAQRTIKHANALGEKGDRLLGLPTSD